jgi:hypothetical protein
MPGRRPLLNTAADQKLLVVDQSRRRAIDAIRQSRNVLISGEPGSGKSTVLYRALLDAGARGRRALMLSGRLVEDSRELADALLALAEEEDWVPEAPRPDPSDPLGPARQVRRLRDAPENALVLVDDLSVEQSRTLFGQLRDELWQTPVNFAAAVAPDVAQALSSPPADAFFDDRLALEPFSGQAAQRLLTLRAHAGETSLVGLEPEAAMQPRTLVALAAGAHLDGELQHELMELARKAAGRPGAMLLAEMWGREGVSASDDELQHRLGVTRNRLTELLRRLAKTGVLRAYPEPREGKIGRPRVIYTVRGR